MRRTAALALAVALLAACGEDYHHLDVESSRTAKDGAAGPAGPVDLVDTGARDAGGAEDLRSVAAFEAFEDEFGGGGDQSDGEAERVTIRVTSADGSPAAGAEVFLFEPEEGEFDSVLRDMREGVDSQRFLEARGEMRAADDEGVVHFAAVQRDGLVGARLGDEWGSAQLRANATETTIVLAAALHLDVRVVGVDGLPVTSVPVALHRSRRGEVRESRVEPTGDDGVATFRHPDELFRQGGGDGEWFVAPAVAMADPPTVRIDPDALPEDAVELVLPPMASLRVELVEIDGDPFTGRGVLEVGVDGVRGRVSFEAAVEGTNVVDVPFVEPGAALDLGFRREGSLSRVRTTAGAPVLAGVLGEVRFVLSPDHPVLVAHLVDESGDARPDVRVAFRLRDDVAVDDGRGRGRRDGRDTGDRYATADAEGTLFVDLPGEWGGDARPLVGSVRTLARGDDVEYAGVFSVVLAVEQGVVDVGRVVLSPPPLLVAGRVVDDIGAPVADAWISFHQRFVDDSGRPRWRRLPDLFTRSDQDGAFRVVAWPPANDLAVSAGSRDHVRGEIVPFDRGSSGVTLVLQGAGRIAGSVLLPDGIDRRRVTIGAVLGAVAPERDVLAQASVSRTSPSRRNDEFEMSRVPPGLYTVWLAYADVPDVLFVVGEVDVRAGATTRDPRLDPIDLSDVLHPLTLQFEQQDGTTPRSLQARWRPTGSDEWRGLGLDRRGRAFLVSETKYVDVEASARGCSPTRFDGVDASSTLVLDPALVVSVEIPKGSLPDAAFRFDVTLRRTDWDRTTSTATVDREGHGEFASLGPGEYVVTYRLSKRGGGRRDTRTFSASPPESVVVERSAGEFVVRPKVPHAKLEDAVRALQ
ncbi:MAG: hypothetical protein R3F34_10445 [Planctomycetota bacterium]